MQVVIAVVFFVTWAATAWLMLRGLTAWSNGYFPSSNYGKTWDLTVLLWAFPAGVVALGIVALLSWLPAFGVARLLGWLTGVP